MGTHNRKRRLGRQVSSVTPSRSNNLPNLLVHMSLERIVVNLQYGGDHPGRRTDGCHQVAPLSTRLLGRFCRTRTMSLVLPCSSSFLTSLHPTNRPIPQRNCGRGSLHLLRYDYTSNCRLWAKLTQGRMLDRIHLDSSVPCWLDFCRGIACGVNPEA